MEAFKLLVIFILIVLALRKKLSVGLTLFGAGLLTALLYGVNFQQVLSGYGDLVISRRFISLTGIVVLITIMGELLNRLGYLERLTSISEGLPGGRRTASVGLPILVGLMPMPGGSLLSAPLVESVLAQENYSPSFKCVVNYWSRHVVELAMPIYPGLIVAEAMTGVPVGTISLLQLPLSIVMLGLGYLFFARKINSQSCSLVSLSSTIRLILATAWPILLTIAIYGIFKIEMAWGALISLLLLILIGRPKAEALSFSLRQGLSFNLVFLVFGILSFQTILVLSGAVDSIQRLATDFHFPVELIIVVVAFVSGLLTGMLAAMVALSYALLAVFLYQPVIVPSYIILAFISGYTGMMLSPTHLCLTLTNEYFGANLLSVARYMILPLALLLAFGFFLSTSGWPELIYP